MNKLFSFLAITLIALAGCMKVEDSNPEQAAKLNINVQTGVIAKGLITDATLPGGSEIGVFLTDGINSTYDGLSFQNICYTSTGTGESQTWATDDDIMLTSTTGKVTAYYPYDGVSDITSIPVVANDENQVDYMWATPVTSLNNKNNTVTLTMNHALAAVRLKFIKAAYAGTGEVTSVTISGANLATNAVLNATNGSLSDITGSGSVFSNNDSFTLTSAEIIKEFIVVPSGESSAIEINVMVDGMERTAVTSITDIVQGSIYEYTVSVAASDVVLSKVNVSPWVVEVSDEVDVVNVNNLAISGTANCYIANSQGVYTFPTVKGNSSESVGEVSYAKVLWESFGTSTAPSVGDLIPSVKYNNGIIKFYSTSAKGNAVIAACDVNDNILWSWHIWLTDAPEAQVYNNNAGTMMDRNLGATSATPGDVGALGLLYQWGRKDPFLGSSSISSSTLATSTITWPSKVSSTSSTGTIDYVTANPTTFVAYNYNNYDWYYSDVEDVTDDTRWQSSKTIYDPCPPGWRVPDGGSSGVWATAGFASTTYDSTNEGISFSISSPSTTWYPASGARDDRLGGLGYVGSQGRYWSVTPYNRRGYHLLLSNDGDVAPSYDYNRASGYAVRCLQVID